MYKAPRGTVDILPTEQAYWKFAIQNAEKTCQLYGYERIDTPVFEESGLFQRSVGEGTDIVEKEMYTFPDHGNTQMTLRPEGTASVCRAYIEHGMQSLPQPVKLYYITTIFRYERPQAGRYRQHHQFGYEAIGDDDPTLDAEVIDLAWQLYSSIGLKNLTLHLNSIGCPSCRPEYLDNLTDYYAKHSLSLCKDCVPRLLRNPLRLLDCKKDSCHQIAENAPKITGHLCTICKDHFEQVKRLLAKLGIPFHQDPYLVRGLDYYTRTVFEVQPEASGAQSTIGGGGRYDLLIQELGGKPTPAVGFATGFERIILNLKQQDVSPPPIPTPKIYVAYLADGKSEAVKLAKTLRNAGIGTLLAPGGRSLKSQLKQANARESSHVLIVGGEEMTRECVILRNLVQGQQQEIPKTEIVERLKQEISAET